MESKRFGVLWTIDHGYRLVPAGEKDELVVPVFADKMVEAQFDRFFSTASLAANVGKRVFCECQGELREADGSASFFVREVRLYAE